MKIGLWSGAALITIALAGCISTREIPLAPKVARIDTQAEDILFTEQAVPQTMRAAAQATLARGYSHFKFADAGVAANSVATVIMFHADDPEAAAEVLKQYRW